jgi:DNA-binding transcriptional LysR family regulator
MNIESLRVYCEVIRARSFSKGARTLGISQPAASQAVRALEGELGVALVDRSQRPLLPTPAGQRYYTGIQALLRQYEQLNEEVRSHQDEHDGTVRVAAIYSVGIQAMSRCTQLFQAKFRKARVRIEYLRPNRVVEAVINETSDFGVLSYPSSSQNLNVIPLWMEKMVFVCTPEHRLSIRKGIAAGDLEGEDMVSFDHDLIIRRIIDRALAKRHIHVNVHMEFDNIESIKEAIRAGAGVAILPEPSVRREAEVGSLVALPIAIPELVRPIGALLRRRRQPSALTSAFIDLLKQHPTI